MNVLNKLIKNYGGGQAAFARDVGVSSMVVSNWKQRRVPAEQVISICRVSGFTVTPHMLRPDIYPDPNWLPPKTEKPSSLP